jgi:hypothetical protein
LSRDTGVDLAVVDRDVHNFLEQLKAKHLLTEAERDRPAGLFRWPPKLP